MAPALEAGDYVVTIPMRTPTRGTVVVFEHPHQPGFMMVKRIIGLPGEEIAISNGTVTVDGKALDDGWTTVFTAGEGLWTLTDGLIFVLGDHRTMSSDSRTMGPISTIGCRRVVARYWPRPRLKL